MRRGIGVDNKQLFIPNFKGFSKTKPEKPDGTKKTGLSGKP